MKITWNIIEKGAQIRIELAYNMYFGIKKLYVDSREIFVLKSLREKGDISFERNGNQYKIHLVPDNYGYTGTLLTPEGKCIAPDVEEKIYPQVPWWTLLFIAANVAIPVISVEAATSWIIAAVASLITIKVDGSDLSTAKKVLISIIISAAAWTLYIIFYFVIRKVGLNGGLFTY